MQHTSQVICSLRVTQLTQRGINVGICIFIYFFSIPKLSLIDLWAKEGMLKSEICDMFIWFYVVSYIRSYLWVVCCCTVYYVLFHCDFLYTLLLWCMYIYPNYILLYFGLYLVLFQWVIYCYTASYMSQYCELYAVLSRIFEILSSFPSNIRHISESIDSADVSRS